jgi:putative Ca2+/H+ antiporter (TMEM165/GDT1 family)
MGIIASALPQPAGVSMQALVVSALAVALAEMGDKTQLLSLILAAKYRRPWAIIAGILIATLCNHALAGALGTVVAQWLTPQVVRWITAISFMSVAAWTLVPDKIDEKDAARGSGHSVFIATAISFFIAEMGDKTQIATIVLAAEYHPLWQVVAGSTLGMLAANVPVVLLGARFAEKIPLRVARIVTALLYAGLGLWIAFSG